MVLLKPEKVILSFRVFLSFTFHYGLIKTHIALYKFFAVLPLHSTMVLLKPRFGSIRTNWHLFFTFHYGLIKTAIKYGGATQFDDFTFHYGLIKT